MPKNRVYTHDSLSSLGYQAPEAPPLDTGGGDDALIQQIALVEKEKKAKADAKREALLRELEKAMAQQINAPNPMIQQLHQEQIRHQQQRQQAQQAMANAIESTLRNAPNSITENGEEFHGPIPITVEERDCKAHSPFDGGGQVSCHGEYDAQGNFNTIAQHSYVEGKVRYQIYFKERWWNVEPRLFTIFEGPRRLMLPEKCIGKVASPMPYYGPRYQVYLSRQGHLKLVPNVPENTGRMVQWDGESEDGNFLEDRLVKLSEEDRALVIRGLKTIHDEATSDWDINDAPDQ